MKEKPITGRAFITTRSPTTSNNTGTGMKRRLSLVSVLKWRLQYLNNGGHIFSLHFFPFSSPTIHLIKTAASDLDLSRSYLRGEKKSDPFTSQMSNVSVPDCCVSPGLFAKITTSTHSVHRARLSSSRHQRTSPARTFS